MKSYLFTKIAASVLTSFIFAFVAGYILENEDYDYSIYFLGLLIVGSPAIFVLGTLFTFILEAFLTYKPITRKYLLIPFIIVSYVFAGFIGTWIYSAVLNDFKWSSDFMKETIYLSQFGMLAAIIYLLIFTLLNLILRKKE